MSRCESAPVFSFQSSSAWARQRRRRRSASPALGVLGRRNACRTPRICFRFSYGSQARSPAAGKSTSACSQLPSSLNSTTSPSPSGRRTRERGISWTSIPSFRPQETSASGTRSARRFGNNHSTIRAGSELSGTDAFTRPNCSRFFRRTHAPGVGTRGSRFNVCNGLTCFDLPVLWPASSSQLSKYDLRVGRVRHAATD